ncbi:MAG: CxxxxCH/CxxCH domain-containing protein [Deltaproteobacteria bacterium]|nr:CxxxxCH/CxxCH domain-containing protein [Deltaproteobacteria bacterium]
MRPHAWLNLALGTLAATVCGCTSARDEARPPACYDYDADIQPLLSRECEECHDASRADGGFRVDTYAQVVTPSPAGVRRATAGDPESPILTRANGAGGHPTASASTRAVLERWVVACNLSFMPTDLVHPQGFVDPAAPAFHGRALALRGYDLDLCGRCHGDSDDTAGGPSGKSCMACHPSGATACDTCHGDATNPAPPRALNDSVAATDPGVGAHRVHLDGGAILHRPFGCSACHLVPTSWRDLGHLSDASGNPDPDGRAEVSFGKLASLSLEGFESLRHGEPSYDRTSGTCRNIYCHGGALAAGIDPVWTAPVTGAQGCATCHPMPPGGTTHPRPVTTASCAACHGYVVDDALQIRNPALHLDGSLSLDDTAATCSACHGGAANAAPPRGVAGETEISSPAVGAHQAHVAASRFSSPIDCGACHLRPQGGTFLEAVAAPGHIDGALPAEVFPAAVGFTGLAAADHAAPVYDRTVPSDPTCTGIYCHAGGDRLAGDLSAAVHRTLRWTDVGNQTIDCGSCHGLPPTVGVGHLPTTPLADCVLCHSLAVDDSGALVFDANGRTRHLDGVVDFNQ